MRLQIFALCKSAPLAPLALEATMSIRHVPHLLHISTSHPPQSMLFSLTHILAKSANFCVRTSPQSQHARTHTFPLTSAQSQRVTSLCHGLFIVISHPIYIMYARVRVRAHARARKNAQSIKALARLLISIFKIANNWFKVWFKKNSVNVLFAFVIFIKSASVNLF